MSVFVPVVACVKHLARLRSWHERNRSAAFCVVRPAPRAKPRRLADVGQRLTSWPGCST